MIIIVKFKSIKNLCDFLKSIFVYIKLILKIVIYKTKRDKFVRVNIKLTNICNDILLNHFLCNLLFM